MRSLKRRILALTRKRETYGIGNLSEPPREGGNVSSLRVRELRRARSIDQEELVVGLEDDAKILLEKLLADDDGDRKRYMISIFGMGGLGKTALARKLYNSGNVKRRFEYRAWTYVSQEYKTRDILMRIIRSLGVVSAEETEKMRMYAEEELEVYLYSRLQGKRYLVVVDDIWEREAWDSLKRALPCNSNGNRVIITTRIKAVAEGVDERVYAHKLRFLTFEESWKLFEQKAFRNMPCGSVNEDLNKMGKEMVRKCSGLPLAIVVLAGLLSRKRPSEWTDMCACLWRRLKDNSIHISTVFDLSFKEMQHELKLCFLYLSIFPEDYKIDVEKLIHLLVAEGFAQEDDEMTMEDTARYYIEELIDRCLVKAEVIGRRGKVLSCRVHDLLRDVAIKKAKELNFVHVYNEKQTSSSSSNYRREVVHQLMNSDYLCDRRVNKQMRSFLFFGERKGVTLESYVDAITLKLNLLRVLNLGGLQFVCKGSISLSLPDVIGELIHLRYLGIAHTGLRCLPATISNLQILQTLDASGYSNKFEQTTDLSNLTSLRHLMGRFTGKLMIGKAVNLQTLRCISSYSWSILKHEFLQNLRELEINDSKPVNRTAPVDWASFSKLTHLRVLKLEVEAFTLTSKSEEAVKVMGLVFPSLESLTLVGSELEEDLMPALQKLPRLEDLVLKDCQWPEGNMRIRAQGFGLLRKFELINVTLHELQIDEEAMPSLMELNLRPNGRPRKVMIPGRLRAFAQGFYITCE
ncbi:unnamed protein product [Eruca vesicaria subsp. sativa]|uniref:Uncharacterized protein n=1 Tax=Eruca vesicaria subsp. sativa TaxID=29727 RepID=A0ABC8JDA1_ERUVS|nr:unnamed protein product [Eruca vesicaria subsp. sativa]